MRYVVRCIDPSGRLVEQLFDAGNPEEARQRAAQPGWAVLAVRRRQFSVRRRTGLDTVRFADELAALLQAGVSVPEALEVLAERQPRAQVQQQLQSVVLGLQQGQRLSAALAAGPGLVPDFLLASVRSAETSGQLSEALRRYVAYQSRVDALRERITQALVYPAVVASVGAAVVAFLLFYVVPRFAAVFAGVDAELPWGSRLLLGFGSWLDVHAGWVAAGLLGLLALVLAAAADATVRERLWVGLAALPGVRPLHRLYRLSVFYRNLALLLQGGMPLPQALATAASTLGAGLAPSAQHAADALQRGVGVAAALEQHGLTTPVSRRMLGVAERTGGLAGMLEAVADFHDAELARASDRLARLFEPLVMLLLGLVIGGVVVLLYLPIFDLAGAVG